jgi:hypothetical protein
MIRFTTFFLCLIMSATLAFAQLDVDSLTDAEVDHLIQQVKRIPASRLDAALPPITFAKWLQLESGPGAQISWVLRYRDATSADPGDNFPTCVETDARMRDGRSIAIFIGIGTPGRFKTSNLLFSVPTCGSQISQLAMNQLAWTVSAISPPRCVRHMKQQIHKRFRNEG